MISEAIVDLIYHLQEEPLEFIIGLTQPLPHLLLGGIHPNPSVPSSEVDMAVHLGNLVAFGGVAHGIGHADYPAHFSQYLPILSPYPTLTSVYLTLSGHGNFRTFVSTYFITLTFVGYPFLHMSLP